MKRKKRANKEPFRINVVEMAMQPRLEIFGNRELVIDGCAGVLEYSAEKIRVRYGRMVLQIIGRNLKISNLGAKSLSVTGFFTGFEFLS